MLLKVFVSRVKITPMPPILYTHLSKYECIRQEESTFNENIDKLDFRVKLLNNFQASVSKQMILLQTVTYILHNIKIINLYSNAIYGGMSKEIISHVVST